MSTGKGILEGMRSIYERSGKSLTVLRAQVEGANRLLSNIRRSLLSMRPSDRPSAFLLDVNRLLARFGGYSADIREAPGESTPGGIVEDVARQVFAGYDRGHIVIGEDEAEDLGAGASYTPTSSAEFEKLGDILSQALELGAIAGAVNFSSAWNQVQLATVEAASELGGFIAGSAAGRWVSDAFDATADAAAAAAKGIAWGLVALGVLGLYLVTRTERE